MPLAVASRSSCTCASMHAHHAAPLPLYLFEDLQTRLCPTVSLSLPLPPPPRHILMAPTSTLGACTAALLLPLLMLLLLAVPPVQATSEVDFDPFHQGQDLYCNARPPPLHYCNTLSMYCSACGHVVSTFNELAGPLFKKTLSSDKKAKVAAKVLADVCSKSGVDSVSGGAGERKFVNFMKMQQVGGGGLRVCMCVHVCVCVKILNMQQEGSMSFDNLNMGSNIADQVRVRVVQACTCASVCACARV